MNKRDNELHQEPNLYTRKWLYVFFFPHAGQLQYKKSWSVNPRTSRFSIQFSHFFLFYCMQLCARLCYPSCALWQLCKWFILEKGCSPRLLQDLQKGKIWLAVNRSLFLLLHPFSCSPLEVWRSKRFHGRNPQTESLRDFLPWTDIFLYIC